MSLSKTRLKNGALVKEAAYCAGKKRNIIHPLIAAALLCRISASHAGIDEPAINSDRSPDTITATTCPGIIHRIAKLLYNPGMQYQCIIIFLVETFRALCTFMISTPGLSVARGMRTELSTLKPECIQLRIPATTSSSILQASSSSAKTFSCQASSARCFQMSGICTKCPDSVNTPSATIA